MTKRNTINIESAMEAERERRNFYAKEQRMLKAEEEARAEAAKSLEERLAEGMTVQELIENLSGVEAWIVYPVDQSGNRAGGKILARDGRTEEAMAMKVVRYELEDDCLEAWAR